MLLLAVVKIACFHQASYFIAKYMPSIYKKMTKGQLNHLHRIQMWLTASRLSVKEDMLRSLIKEIEAIMPRFNQLDLEDLQFRATLSLIMSWMIKPNNKRKDTRQPIASKWHAETWETQEKWGVFYEVLPASWSPHLLPGFTSMICLKQKIRY